MRLAGRVEPSLGDLGLQRVIARSGVAVPQLGQVEPNNVEPLGLLIWPSPGLVFSSRAFVADDGDLTFRASHVLLRTRIEQDREFLHNDLVAYSKLRFAGLPGKYLRVAFADGMD